MTTAPVSTLIPVLVEYPFEIPAYPSKPGHAFVCTNAERSLSVLEDERLDWLGPLAIELPEGWDGARIELWFHDDDCGLRTLRPIPGGDGVSLFLSGRA